MKKNQRRINKMRAKNDKYLGWIVTEGTEKYNETESAQATSRLLDGSSDYGYAAEYVGYGDIDGIPVKAIYLFADDQIDDAEDGGDLDWDTALSHGRIIVDINALTDAQWDDLQKTGTVIE